MAALAPDTKTASERIREARATEGYILLVQRKTDNQVFFVGRRDSLRDLLESVDDYSRDPLSSDGKFFGVHITGDRKVTWSDDWVAVVDGGLVGAIDRVFHPGYGDPYAQYEEYFLRECQTR